MRRRDVLLGIGASFASGAARAMSQEEIARKVAEGRAKALAVFPFKRTEVAGADALATWQALKAAGGGAPVVFGGDDELHAFSNLLDPFLAPDYGEPPLRPVDAILADAAKIDFPAGLAAKRQAEDAAALASLRADLAKNPNLPLPTIIEDDGQGHKRTYSRDETLAQMLAPHRDPPLGNWPAKIDPSAGLSVATDLLKGTPLAKVYVGVAPTRDATEIPAYLRYGGWNGCPEAEYHVAALRRWRDRYGAELVGLSFDTMNLRVARRPQTREEALALAREHYIYCSDIVEQGTLTFSALAAQLMADDWWYFWWD